MYAKRQACSSKIKSKLVTILRKILTKGSKACIYARFLVHHNIYYVPRAWCTKDRAHNLWFIYIYIHNNNIAIYNNNRSTPVESLHSILLGPYKYLLKITIPTLSSRQKDEILSRIRAFNFSGFSVKLHGNVIRHHQSFVGRDYKAWAQMAPFVIFPYLTEGDKMVWLSLSKVI